MENMTIDHQEAALAERDLFRELLLERTDWWWREHGKDYLDYINGDDRWFQIGGLIGYEFDTRLVAPGKRRSNAST